MGEALSPEDLASLVYSVTTDSGFSERDQEYEQMRLLVFQQRPVKIPGLNLKVQFHDPSLEDNAHQFKNRILAAPIRINVAAKSLADRAVEKARAQEKFYYRYYNHWRAQGRFDPVLFDMAAFSIGWLYLTVNWELIPDLPEMQKGEDGDDYCSRIKPLLESFSEEEHDFFEVNSARANTMYWSPGKDYIVQRSQVPYTQLATEYAKKGKGINLNGNKIEITTIEPGVNINFSSTSWTKRVEFYICADDDYIYHCVKTNSGKPGKDSTQMLGIYPNIFGMPPFFSSEAEITGDSHPLYNTRSLIAPLYQTAPYRNIAMSAKLAAGVDTAQQRYALKKINPEMGDSEDNALEIRVLPGGVLMPPTGYEIVNPGIATGPDLRDAIELINFEHEKYGMPKPIGNPSEVTATSGYDRAQMQQTVSNLLDPPLSHFAAMFSSKLFPALANGVKTLGIDQVVRNVQAGQTYGNPQSLQDSVTIKPDDIIDSEIGVEFFSTTLMDRIAMKEEGMKEMAADLETETEYLMDVKGVDDVEAWRKQRDYDKVRKFSTERAITDVQSAIDALRNQFMQEGMDAAGVPPLIQNSDALRPDRGPSMPIGPGNAMPIAPTPPGFGVQPTTTPVNGSVPGSPMPPQ